MRIGLAYDLFGSYPARPGDPPDAEVEYEPEATVLVLEAALGRLGHAPVRLGNAHGVLQAAGQGGCRGWTWSSPSPRGTVRGIARRGCPSSARWRGSRRSAPMPSR